MEKKTKKFKFVHDEIHGNDFSRVETILELRTDINLFHLMDELREHKMKENQTSIDIFSIHIDNEGEWVKLDHSYNQGKMHLCEPRHEDRLFMYQKRKYDVSGDPLNGKWMSCGGVKQWGTPEENQEWKDFYSDFFSKVDSRNRSSENKVKVFEVIIVRGSFGNVAGRDAREIRDSDIVEKFN